jgi:hypothetical protein
LLTGKEVKEVAGIEPILFIAPSAELAKLAEGVLAEMGVSLLIEIAINQQAVEVYRSYPDISVIIARGGTAEILKQQQPEKNVIEITVSVIDLLVSVFQLANSGANKIGAAFH